MFPTSEQEITAEELKKPEMAQKKPAKSSKQAKAKVSMKKPSVVMAHHHSWVASCSFGRKQKQVQKLKLTFKPGMARQGNLTAW